MGRLVHPRHLSVLHVRTGAAHLIQPEQDPALNLLGIPAARALHQDPERQRSVEPSPDVFEHSTTRPTRPVLRSTKYRVREKTFTRRGFKDPFFIRDGPHLFHQPPIGHARGQPVSSRSFRPQEDPPPLRVLPPGRKPRPGPTSLEPGRRHLPPSTPGADAAERFTEEASELRKLQQTNSRFVELLSSTQVYQIMGSSTRVGREGGREHEDGRWTPTDEATKEFSRQPRAASMISLEADLGFVFFFTPGGRAI